MKTPKTDETAKSATHSKQCYLKDLAAGDRFEIIGCKIRGIVENVNIGSVLVTYDSYSRTNEFGVKENIRAKRIDIGRETVVRCLSSVDS